MHSLQLVLHSCWDFVNESAVVEWSPSNQEDCLWWSDLSNLQGVSLEEIRPDLLFWSDASDRGWGAHLRDQFVRASGLRRNAPCPSTFGSFVRSAWDSTTFVICCRVLWSRSSRTTPRLSLASGNKGGLSPRRSTPKPSSSFVGRRCWGSLSFPSSLGSPRMWLPTS